MADAVTITEDQTGPEAPPPVEQPTDNSTDRPDWLPEKFSSPEDLAKSYAELEKKLSSPQENASETDVAETPQSEAPVFDKFATEFADKGELSVVEATPNFYNELGRKKLIAGKCWSTPTISEGQVLVRSTEEAVSLSFN